MYGFWLVAEHHSFAHAARALPFGSTQALHKRVRTLENRENLNMRLLRSRGVKGVSIQIDEIWLWFVILGPCGSGIGSPASAHRILFQYPIKEADAALFLTAVSALEESSWNDGNFFGGRWREGSLAGLAGAVQPASGAQAGNGRHSDLPSKFTPTAYSLPSSKYSPFTTPDYYTYGDDLVIERNVPGKPHQGKVLAAVEAHSDDIPLFAGGTVSKLIDEGYTGYLIRVSNDKAAGRTLGYGFGLCCSVAR